MSISKVAQAFVQQTWQTSSLNLFWSHNQKGIETCKYSTAETERETQTAFSIWLS